ncbi:hypothetical protein H696_04190 [Fonticula alba]|uniref:Uncharacterized protein n=1 Tax=Fonticula alba TaxID=691883 RepID=A0A058Z8A9_FONAL|nr:hypothetical protein H696_04190 [Fonticula alba]KCV69777.1 hypothetical protein H696_04190 [Fonticula alba]|eukprot:XP_009496342.1 hypothetical protein H696_04190 [Fonticula alba]
MCLSLSYWVPGLLGGQRSCEGSAFCAGSSSAACVWGAPLGAVLPPCLCWSSWHAPARGQVARLRAAVRGLAGEGAPPRAASALARATVRRPVRGSRVSPLRVGIVCLRGGSLLTHSPGEARRPCFFAPVDGFGCGIARLPGAAARQWTSAGGFFVRLLAPLSRTCECSGLLANPRQGSSGRCLAAGGTGRISLGPSLPMCAIAVVSHKRGGGPVGQSMPDGDPAHGRPTIQVEIDGEVLARSAHQEGQEGRIAQPKEYRQLRVQLRPEGPRSPEDHRQESAAFEGARRVCSRRRPECRRAAAHLVPDAPGAVSRHEMQGVELPRSLGTVKKPSVTYGTLLRRDGNQHERARAWAHPGATCRARVLWHPADALRLLRALKSRPPRGVTGAGPMRDLAPGRRRGRDAMGCSVVSSKGGPWPYGRPAQRGRPGRSRPLVLDDVRAAGASLPDGCITLCSRFPLGAPPPGIVDSKYGGRERACARGRLDALLGVKTLGRGIGRLTYRDGAAAGWGDPRLVGQLLGLRARRALWLAPDSHARCRSWGLLEIVASACSFAKVLHKRRGQLHACIEFLVFRNMASERRRQTSTRPGHAEGGRRMRARAQPGEGRVVGWNVEFGRRRTRLRWREDKTPKHPSLGRTRETQSEGRVRTKASGIATRCATSPPGEDIHQGPACGPRRCRGKCHTSPWRQAVVMWGVGARGPMVFVVSHLSAALCRPVVFGVWFPAPRWSMRRWECASCKGPRLSIRQAVCHHTGGDLAAGSLRGSDGALSRELEKRHANGEVPRSWGGPCTRPSVAHGEVYGFGAPGVPR